MKREKILLVIFSFLLPITDVIYKNIQFYTSINIGDSVLYIGVYFIVFCLLFIILSYFIKNNTKGFTITIVFEILFFNYYTSISLQYRILIVLFGILFIFIISYVTKNEILNKIKLFFFLYLILNMFLTLSKGINFYYNTNQRIVEADIWNQKTKFDSNIKPNIYFIVIDQMASLEVAKKEFGIDTTTFAKFLRENDYILPKAHSNYLYTPLSISSILAGNYLTSYVEKQDLNYQFVLGTQFIKNNLNLTSELKKRGYRTTNHGLFSLNGANNTINFNSYLVKENRPLMLNTILSIDLHSFFRKIKLKNDKIKINFIKSLITNENRIFEQLQLQSSEKTFNYFHLFTTHDPFFF